MFERTLKDLANRHFEVIFEKGLGGGYWEKE